MVHEQQLKVMAELLGHERRTGRIDQERFLLLCKRQGLVAEMQTLNEFSKNLKSSNSAAEAELAVACTLRIIKLSGQIQSINRKLCIY